MNLTVWRGFHLQRKGNARSRTNNEELLVMKLTTISVAVAAMLVFAQSAQAREHHRYRVTHREAVSQYGTQGSFGFSGQYNAYSGTSPRTSQLGGRPAAWCGWEMRQLVSSDPGPAFNLARNWASWGRPGPAGVGAVVVWSHHVGKIVGQQGGDWVVESGNDGHAIRTRPRSLAGVIAIRWG
jgi:hypothetical protein